MEWNNRQPILQKWPAFGVQQIHVQQQQQPQQLQQQHQLQHPQQQHPQQQQQQQTAQGMPQHLHHSSPTPMTQISPKISRTGGSSTPHCLVCNVHLGMFAKGGMEVFSEKVTTSCGKMQIHSVLGSIINQELTTTSVHSSIVCKKCFKLLDDIDNLEGQLVGMKQVVSSKYTMTLALVKKGLVGKAVLEECYKSPTSPTKAKKSIRSPVSISEKTLKTKGASRRGRPAKMRHLPKGGKLEVKSGRLVVKGVADDMTPEVELREGGMSDDDDDDYAGDGDGYDFQNENLPGDSDATGIEEIPVDEDSITHSCGHCGKEFSSRIVLATHIETHGIRNDSYKCVLCDKSFLNNESFIKHKKLHTKSKKQYLKRKQVCQAFNITHIKKFKCGQCSKVFSTKSKAEDHERTHTGEKPFECDICGTCFRQKSNLSSHVRVTHLQEKRYKCELCDKSFKWKRLLNGHTMSVHTGERPYKCEFCDSGFVYQQHFKKHMRIHTGEKPFKCEVCGKAFNSSNNCKAHMFTHSEKKPYECTICGAGFMRKPLVLSHIRQHGNVDGLEGYVKANSPTAVVSSVGEASGDNERNALPGTSIIRKKKVSREPVHTAVVHMPQGTQQTTHSTVEETIPHLFIQNNDNREAANSGETMSYMFSTFPAQGTVTHYTPLNLGQW